ncbi:MAG: hypothetical protein Q9191_006719 [Dirinaria sp. TL-2023a]
MSNASLVPYEHVQKTLSLGLVDHIQNGRDNFLIDGFPRSKEQTQFFDGKGGAFPTQALKAVMLARMLKRAETSGRVDDTAEVFRKRYAAHMEEISSVTEAFPGKVIDVRVDCERALDDIYEELKGQVKEIFGIVQEPKEEFDEIGDATSLSESGPKSDLKAHPSSAS